MAELNIKLEPGIKAYPVPDLSERVRWEVAQPSPEVAQALINEWLAHITEQGGIIRGIITVPVTVKAGERDPRDLIEIGSDTQVTAEQFLIVEK